VPLGALQLERPFGAFLKHLPVGQAGQRVLVGQRVELPGEREVFAQGHQLAQYDTDDQEHQQHVQERAQRAPEHLEDHRVTIAAASGT